MTQHHRLVPLIAAGVLLIAGAAFYRHYFLRRPVGSGPAGPAVPAALFTAPWTDRRVFLLGLGDNITDGAGAARHHTYFDLLCRNPDDEAPEMIGIDLHAVLPRLRLYNRAIGGSTSASCLEDQIARLAPQPADCLGLVVITTGGNDILKEYGEAPPHEGAMFGATLAQALPWVDAFERRLEVMVEMLDAKFPGGCRIFLANIYDPTDDVGDTEAMGLPSWPDGHAILRACNAAIAGVMRREFLVLSS